MIIAVDFDGTCTTHNFPRVGEEIGAGEVLRELVGKGHQIILNTMRSGEELEHAVEWFRINQIPLFGINENPQQKAWTKSPKVYAHMYIDDAALGCPVKEDKKLSTRPFVDWAGVKAELKKCKIL